MALLKSRALQLLEDEEKLRQKNAEECYALLASWEAKEPVITPTIELAARKLKEDITPFGYHYGNTPSRSASRHKRWSDI
jgi:hypothetical protein